MEFMEPAAAAATATAAADTALNTEGAVLRLRSEKMGGSEGIVAEPALADEGCEERMRSSMPPAVHVLESSRVEARLPVGSRTERGSGDVMHLGSRGSGHAVISSAGRSKLRLGGDCGGGVQDTDGCRWAEADSCWN